MERLTAGRGDDSDDLARMLIRVAEVERQSEAAEQRATEAEATQGAAAQRLLDQIAEVGPPVSSVPSSTNVTSTSSTKNASEQVTWRCGNGRLPPGGSVRSISEKSPPVWAAIALNAITLPRAV